MILFLLMFRVVCGVFRGFGISFFFWGWMCILFWWVLFVYIGRSIELK